MRRRRVRILLLADTHLGFDMPVRPKIVRRRRGPDFFANFERALQPAHRGEVDLVVHGGDLLYRSKVTASLVQKALEPLLRVADQGIPVFIVPGNHERSRIPFPLLAIHPNLHIFHEPTTFVCRVSKIDVALSGFPFEYRVDGVHFDRLLTMTSYRDIRADIHLLCMHQVVEGAQVGPSDYTFRKGPQVVSGASIPADFTAVLSGHIHRYQILTHDLAMRRLASPVLYPGAIERTSFAEKHERKGYLTIEVAPDRRGPARLARTVFTPLPTRPMVTLDGDGQSETVETMYADIRERLSKLPPDAIVRIRIRRSMSHEVKAGLRLDRLRQLAPSSMDVRVVPVRNR